MRRLAWACAVVSFACGGGTGGGGSATFDGTVRGQSMRPQDAVSTPFGDGRVIISNVGGICASMEASRQPRNWTTLDIQVADELSTGFSPPAGTGSFTVVPSSFAGPFPAHWAVAGFNLTDGLCQNLVGGSAVSGTVTLTSNAGGAYAGSFDLIFDSGDHVTGTFAAAHCAGIQTFFMAAGNNTVTCG